jgi:hypothetical protein
MKRENLTPDEQAMMARQGLSTALRALAEFNDNHAVPCERLLSMEEVLARLGITYEVFRKRKLANELPIIEFSNETKVVREATLNEFIVKREKLARARLKDVSKSA